MRRARTIIPKLLTISLVIVSATAAADDLQVIQSQFSVLSIYSYGGTPVMSKTAPELAGGTRQNRATGALTDVVSTPQLSVPAPPPPSRERTSAAAQARTAKILTG